MGIAHQTTALSRPGEFVGPSAEELVAEVRAARADILADTLSARALSSAGGWHRASVLRVARRLAIDPVYIDPRGQQHFTRADAKRIVEAMV